MDCLMTEYCGDTKGSNQEHHILLAVLKSVFPALSDQLTDKLTPHVVGVFELGPRSLAGGTL